MEENANVGRVWVEGQVELQKRKMELLNSRSFFLNYQMRLDRGVVASGQGLVLSEGEAVDKESWEGVHGHHSLPLAIGAQVRTTAPGV